MAALLYQQCFVRSCFSVRCLQFSSIICNIQRRNKFCIQSSTELKSPLLNIKELPNYNEIDAVSVRNAIPVLVQSVENKFAEFEKELAQEKTYNWDNVVPKSELIADKLGLAWSAVTHLQAVRNSPSFRVAYHEVQPQVVMLLNKISQSKVLFEVFKYLEKNGDSYDEAQRRIITSALRTARNSGVHVEGEQKEEFNNITQELAELGTQFMNNVLDSTKNYSYLIYDKEDTKGLPLTLLSLMATSASQQLNITIDPDVGPWKLSLDLPCFEPFMKHSVNRTLREKIYKAYISRASTDDFNNSNIVERIRKLMKTKSNILGYNYYSLLSLEKKMAKTPDAVWKMITDLKTIAKPVAEEELKDLQTFATASGFEGSLKHWDLSYWSERQRENLFNLNDEKLREYFPFSRVLEGLFSLTQELFSIQVKEQRGVSTWHKDVKFFNINSQNGAHIASFFLDPYSRPEEKRGGAWMDTALGRNDALGRKPVAYLVCNQIPPVGETPSLMSFREVLTLFHEFGHGLQHMLTTVQYPSAAGINNVEWDAVELPSQFMENWLYDYSTIQRISSHYQSGDSLPRVMFNQLVKGRMHHAGMSNLRQLYFSALDMELYTSDEDWSTVMKRISDGYTLMKPLEEDSFPCSFMHIFGGGYSAGYYSYKWAEVLSADAFSLFTEIGLDNREQVAVIGKRFRDTILSQGGSRHPEDVFVDFRGRRPKIDALLTSYGLSRK